MKFTPYSLCVDVSVDSSVCACVWDKLPFLPVFAGSADDSTHSWPLKQKNSDSFIAVVFLSLSTTSAL